MKTLPGKWTLHGTFAASNIVGGALPHTGLHYLVNTAGPTVLAGAIADLAVSIASNLVDQPLRVVPGSPRRSPAGFMGGRGSSAPEAVAILNAKRGLDIGAAVQAAALGRGVTRPIDVAWSSLSGGTLVSTPDALRRLHELNDFLSSEIGLVVIIDNFAGSRVADCDMMNMALMFASAIRAPILIVTDNLPEHVEPDSVIMRLSDSELCIDNPAAPNVAPFKCAITKEQIAVEGEDATIVNLGPRRVHTPAITKKELEPSPKVVGRPKADQAGETVYLLMTGRQLEPDELALFGESKHTPDYRTAIKWAGQSTHKRAEIVIVASHRDPRRESAGSAAQHVKAELLNAGLDQKVIVRVSEEIQIAA